LAIEAPIGMLTLQSGESRKPEVGAAAGTSQPAHVLPDLHVVG
jgi:hypothetical protein